ncbi:wiskott-Aldrich syndrome protein homolog 1-like [Mustela erminea]|uniref:wiskott-Aldrich syndrome protein homolog 1-like n=1 Tax=Mustela erminea TaxID=36723 RepID=UPI0013869DE8|nr:wiskott-Aldrich syndrome protein homolog 1-like [Mustela erminea]
MNSLGEDNEDKKLVHQTPQTFWTERRWDPETPLAANGTPALVPRNFSLDLRTPLAPPPAPGPAVRGPAAPAGASADPPDSPGARGRRRRCPAGGCDSLPASAGQPQRAGSGPERPVSHRPQHGVGRRPRRRHLPAPQTARGPRGKRQKVSLLLSRPARDRRTTSLGLHLPRRARAATAAAKVRLFLVPGAGRGLCPLVRPSLPGCVQTAAPRSRRDPDAAGGRAGGRPAPPLAGDSPAPPVEPHNGRLGWSLPCACTSAPPPTRQARALGHEHTHKAHSPPFLACSLAPPVRPLATRSRGRGLSEGHTHLGRGDGEEVPPLTLWTRALASVGCAWDVSPGVPGSWQSFGKDCSSHYECFFGRMEGSNC